MKCLILKSFYLFPDPCKEEGVCGPNALCQCSNHETVCRCPEGFQGNPIPQQGCVRIPSSCQVKDQCPKGYMCKDNVCKQPCRGNGECAVGERCQAGICIQICYGGSNCLAGEVCVSGMCKPGCGTDADCNTSQVCVDNKCRLVLFYSLFYKTEGIKVYLIY